MRAIVFFILAIVLTGVVITLKNKLSITLYGGGVLQELGVCTAIGVVGAALIVGSFSKTASNGKHAVAVAASGTYTPEKDFDPDSSEPQYILTMPGVPWSSVWYQEDDGYLDNFTEWPCYVENVPYQIQENGDGTTDVIYEDPYDPGTLKPKSRIRLSNDGLHMEQIFNDEFSQHYVRPERSKADALPSEMWGIWVCEDDVEPGRLIEIAIDAFSVIKWWYDPTYGTLGQFICSYDELKEIPQENETAFHIKSEHDGSLYLGYSKDDGVERIDIFTNPDEYYEIDHQVFVRISKEEYEREAENERGYILDTSDPLNPTWPAREM